MAEYSDRRDGVLRLDGRSHAVGPGRRGGNGNHYGWGDKGGKAVMAEPRASGPDCGGGLPVLLVAGGYAMVRAAPPAGGGSTSLGTSVSALPAPPR